MKFDSYLVKQNGSGLFELRNDGTILYSRFRQNNQLINTDDDFAGRNFFEEIAGFDNVKDLQKMFNDFVKSRQFTDNFIFACRYGEDIVPVKVMMVRAYENTIFAHDGIVILDIRSGIH